MIEKEFTSMDEDADMVSSCKRGDLDAFESLVKKYEKRMLNISYRITGSYEDACEIVQDAFVSAYREIKNFRGKAKFSTWLTAITINLSRNRLKQVKARYTHEQPGLNNPIQTGDGELMPDPPSNDPSVLDRLEKKDIRQAVQDCIGVLEQEFREAIILRDMQDFTYEEIGAMLKVREGTVKSRIFRAREMVKDCLKRAMGEL